MSDPIPGWYPDPEEPSRQRFWDGSQWTEARAYPVATAPDGTPIAADTAGDSGSKSLNGKTIALIVGLAVLVALALWFFLLRGSSTTEPLPVVTPTATPVTPTDKPTTPTKAPTEPPVTPTVAPTLPVTPTAVPSP